MIQRFLIEVGDENLALGLVLDCLYKARDVFVCSVYVFTITIKLENIIVDVCFVRNDTLCLLLLNFYYVIFTVFVYLKSKFCRLDLVRVILSKKAKGGYVLPIRKKALIPVFLIFFNKVICSFCTCSGIGELERIDPFLTLTL